MTTKFTNELLAFAIAANAFMGVVNVKTPVEHSLQTALC